MVAEAFVLPGSVAASGDWPAAANELAAAMGLAILTPSLLAGEALPGLLREPLEDMLCIIFLKL